jgi:hypothetical protein
MENIKSSKKAVSDLIEPFLKDFDLSFRNQKGKELIDLAKFILTSGEEIKILAQNIEEPDFIIKWNDEKYGIELTDAVNKKHKQEYEEQEKFVKKIESAFIEKYGNIKKHINVSFNYELRIIKEAEKRKYLKSLKSYSLNLKLPAERIFEIAYPCCLANTEIDTISKKIADDIFTALDREIEYFEDNAWLRSISFGLGKETSINRTVCWSADSSYDFILERIKEKEKKYATYMKNTKGLKQCLLVVVDGARPYSDYSMLDTYNLKKDIESSFDRIFLLNFFNEQLINLK